MYTCTRELSLVQDQNTQLLDTDRGIKISSAMNQVSSESLSLLFPPPSSLFGCPHGASLIVQGPLEQEPSSTLTLISEPCWGVVLSASTLPKYICCLSCFPGQVFRRLYIKIIYNLFVYYLNTHNVSIFYRGFPGQHSKE